MSEAEPRLSTSLSTTPRLYVEMPLHAGAVLTLPLPQSHYLAQVMRRQPGDMVRLFNGRDGEWAARLTSVGRKAVLAELLAQSAPQEVVPDLWLCFAPIKRGRIDWLVEKACELGVARLVPVITRRTVVDKLNLDRLRAHMVEAAEQCGRTALPALGDAVGLPALLATWPDDRWLYFADEAGGTALTSAVRPGPAAILVGPEGGFMTEEAAAITALDRAVRVSLGPRILRADTAAIAAIAVWQSVAGDSGGHPAGGLIKG
ncbi:MAG: 16S rRNA (uracil(1498)-N(3))-methyltransferase [Polymorphobacter sp.]